MISAFPFGVCERQGAMSPTCTGRQGPPSLRTALPSSMSIEALFVPFPVVWAAHSCCCCSSGNIDSRLG